MKYKEAIKKIPANTDVSIGCRRGAGWFYFTKSDVLRAETSIVFQIMDSKMKKSLNQLRYNLPSMRSQLNNPKFIQRVSAAGYIRTWEQLIKAEERIPKAWMEYSSFNIIELLNCECVLRHKIDGSYGILLLRWDVSGNYWSKKEWEGEHGAI